MANKNTRIKLDFSIFGDTVNIEELTQKIGVIPTNSWKKGDVIRSSEISRKLEVRRVRKESAWEFSTGFIQTLFLEEITKIFFNKFEEKMKKIGKYICEMKLEARVNIVIEIVDGQLPSLFLDRDILEITNFLCAEIDIDMYLLNSEPR